MNKGEIVSIQLSVNQQLREAMLNKKAARVLALRDIKAAFITELKKDGSKSLSDGQCVVILRRLAKQRQEAAGLYVEGGSSERAEQELAELVIVNEFLPSLASDEQIRVWVQEIIDSGVSNFGRIMGAIMREHRAEVDGKVVRRIIQNML